MDSRTIIRRLEKEGWQLDRITGSHHTFVKPGSSTIVTVPHPRKDLGKGLLRSIYRQAGWAWPPR
ncbi:MAG: type II toxin-antitoxin system HicA family toxin [Pseudomonadota bacterium]|uniref:type II toxin-antitoxin system HicA family toxin n=1 Tax=Fodinicurvata fenggangensis TaxID=1121830 RepID=UPI00047B23AE|nr:type II toxin-antitoxin system HicA family toxin [Fodinicurvata fenggangensis]